jgi:uncharacterized protein (UPF0248 family)
VPKNPLRELLNRLRHDAAFDDSLCVITYEDFDAPDKQASAKLHLCAIEPRNICYGDSIIPYHRIIKVIYGKTTIYPFGSDPAAERIIKALGKKKSQ